MRGGGAHPTGQPHAALRHTTFPISAPCADTPSAHLYHLSATENSSSTTCSGGGRVGRCRGRVVESSLPTPCFTFSIHFVGCAVVGGGAASHRAITYPTARPLTSSSTLIPLSGDLSTPNANAQPDVSPYTEPARCEETPHETRRGGRWAGRRRARSGTSGSLGIPSRRGGGRGAGAQTTCVYSSRPKRS